MEKKKVKCFLGGTCNNSKWREEFEKKLVIDYFNPVVDDWNEEAYQRELKEREECDFCLYVITPRMEGVYSIAEVVDDSNKRPDKTIFCFIEKDIDTFSSFTFNKSKIKSLNAVGKMIESNGAKWFKSTEECIEYLNGFLSF